jgi:hypothetical protein
MQHNRKANKFTVKNIPLVRRIFLSQLGLVAASAALPARWCSAAEVEQGRELKFRFTVASDLHFGHKNTPFKKMTGEMVQWINEEKERDEYLSKLKVPYYCGKGNHDFVDGYSRLICFKNSTS